MLRELLEVSSEGALTPRPGLIVRNRHDGRYATVSQFNWKSPLTSQIPVKYDDGAVESIPVNAFGRRFEAVNIDKDVPYARKLAISNLDKDVERFTQELAEIEQGLKDLEKSIKELGSKSPLAKQLIINKDKLEQEQAKVRLTLSDLKQKREDYGVS